MNANEFTQKKKKVFHDSVWSWDGWIACKLPPICIRGPGALMVPRQELVSQNVNYLSCKSKLGTWTKSFWRFQYYYDNKCLGSILLFVSFIFCLSFILDPLWQIESSLLLGMLLMILTEHLAYFVVAYVFFSSLFLLLMIALPQHQCVNMY